ncbi:MAG: hypothetical protein A3F82_00020 [Deltaproteobacteria bacterium RIFCSPLOWO2_12_FULL_44_12]|nr:MAG: hypothetical protein A2712_09155 [Deltaproteobacteria bacterium RIFCSPHIGHO2_01_FULL_43_49]OGQ14451.1 MAG: hypothetical protein A3D22_09580 [Deltaproteobacteria bacterium RIFCSPHIGHO2_02_FULL_44_53]OGQ27832.1 MAG: hypothetical protein A3D98_03980 [Deltaproteobacteria bacterium RIFCSPHIGHO2_12_FULL_44_21]OGQ30908.1 MAG: hypothetical protein A2979_01655 [Deltaproteobacteria bacterium RIFCSPLOWO2_01_FULL_45_74]OGQ42568.1 MAG: hypothetical protein A3I70_03700 [Deltaproteobacteria bacterium 
MGAIKKFKSFEEASNALIEESYRTTNKQKNLGKQTSQLANFVGVPYKPGLYRFRSFSEAYEYDLEQYIQQAVKKHLGC